VWPSKDSAAAELSNPLLSVSLLKRGIVKTVKSAKKLVDKKRSIWGFWKIY